MLICGIESKKIEYNYLFLYNYESRTLKEFWKITVIKYN